MARLPSRALMPSMLAALPSRGAYQVYHPPIASGVRGYTSTSAPKDSENASARSGGSRSKEAVETGKSPTGGYIHDSLADGDDARGRTGGGKPLNSSHAAPPQPKIHNGSVPGKKPELTPEQQAEVDEHNREFEKKHGRAEPAKDDRVDKKFWSGGGTREGPGSQTH